VVPLLLADLRLQLDDIPEFEHILLHLFNVYRSRQWATSSHLLDICLELVDAFTHDFRVDNITLYRYLSMRRGRKSDYAEVNKIQMQ
jgi:hypothetical protein